MTPEIRAVLDAAYRVSAHADLPDSPIFGEALHELDSALAALDRVKPEIFASEVKR